MATKLYQPSSGQEGEWFIRQWCGQCERDKCQNGSKSFDDCREEDLCKIIGMTMLYDVKDEEYPREWITDEKEGPRCMAYIHKGGELPKPRCDKTIDMFGGLNED